MFTQSSQANNKRIAKNTIILFIRMLFSMAVSLYTSRVILQALGVEDYGIYNVVGGISGMFCFITAGISQAIQRFITFELGKSSDGDVNKILSVGVEIQIIIGVIMVLIVEAVGIWMLYNKLQIPVERMNAAFWLLQCVVILIPITLIGSPFNALIIAEEKMSAYAYISIFEVLSKLGIVFMLSVSPVDKLIFYGVLTTVVTGGVQLLYYLYCKCNFKYLQLKIVKDFKLIKDILSFSTWTMYGALAYVGYTQGLNILLNIFFGPVVNAARGIATQVQGAVYSFVINFQTAINPQITKSYASDNLSYMHSLIFRSARFSFFLLLLISSPIIFAAPKVLSLWLGTVPEHTVIFVRIILTTCLLTTIENPITYSVQATGNIKKYQLIVNTIRIFIVPIAYTALKVGFPPYSVFVVHFSVEFFVLGIRLLLLRPLVCLSLRKFFFNVVIRVIIVYVLSYISIYFSTNWCHNDLIHLILVCVASLIFIPLLVFCFGLEYEERNMIKTKLKILIVHPGL